MHKALYLLFLLCAGLQSLYAQQVDDFERRYNEVYSAKLAVSVEDAYRIADSLLQSAKNDEQRIKSYMLLANIKHSTGDISMAISHVLKAQRIAELGGYAEWEPRTAGFLATTFRNIGLLSESKKYLTKADLANQKLRNSKGYALTQVSILQEKAFHAVEVELYDVAISILESCKPVMLLDTSSLSRAVQVKATTDQLLGVCYLQLGKLDLADSLLQASFIGLDGLESNLVPYIYRARAEIALKRGDLEAAKLQLDLAQPYIQSSNRTELKQLLYRTYIRYYDQVDISLANHYRSLYQKLSEEQTVLTRKVANELLEKVHAEQKKDEFWSILLWIGVILLLAICIFMAIRMLLDRRAKRLQPVLVQEEVLPVRLILPSVATPTDDSGMHMAKDTEKRLLIRLIELEEEEFFLDPNLSLSKVALLMNTNQRYVSYILKEHKHKDFNEYIQYCRINYIKVCLAHDATLLDCKISYIASLCGFNSHSKFLIAFKAETGLLPSRYIQNLRQLKERKAQP